MRRLPLLRGGDSGPGPRRVMIVLPPDFLAPAPHLRHRFPPMGAAVVAGALREDGVAVGLVDLMLDVGQRPPAVPWEAVLDRARVRGLFHGVEDAALDALADDLFARITDRDADVFAFSVERHTQINPALLLALTIKRRTGRAVVLGGSNFGGEWRTQGLADLAGVDIVSLASSPDEIRAVFRAARDIPRGRVAPPVDPITELRPTPYDDWPLPDFTVFDLDRYRRDPFAADGAAFPSYDGSMGPQLFLPYAMSLDCQYACAFCQRGGTQTVRSMDRVVRDLAALAERHGTRDFLFFNSQLNLHAEAFSKALLAARLDLQWGDSFRVAPRRPRDVLELMRRAGCDQLTFGVESGSDRMLKRMVKGHTAAMATATVQDAHALGIYTRVNLLPCFPGETPEDFALTERWVRDNAYAIDDVAPSAFYMTLTSPVGENPARWGVRVREVRDDVEGDHRFRKAHAPVAYDEEALTWEEREQTLRTSEHELRAAWREGRRVLGLGATRPAQVFALSRRFPTKAEAYASLLTWVRQTPGSPPDVNAIASLLAREGQTRREGPMEVFRGRALAAVRAVVSASLTVEAGPPEQGRVTCVVSSPEGACRFVVERARPDLCACKVRGPLAFWYTARGAEPWWLRAALPLVCVALLSRWFVENAAALGEAGAAAPTGSPLRGSVVDLVRLNVKPAATLLEAEQADPFAGLDDLPAKVTSRLYFKRDALGNLVVTKVGDGRRMLYVGRDAAWVERLRDLEESLYLRPDMPEAEFCAVQDELGRLLGFPACCTRLYGRETRRTTPYADYYAWVERADVHLRPIPWQLNYPMTCYLPLPVLIHAPCGARCDATVALVNKALQALCPGAAGAPVKRALAASAVVFPSDRIIPFQAIGTPDGDEVVVAEFNVDPAPELSLGPREAARGVPVDSQRGFLDSEVEMLRVRDGRLQVFACGCWHAVVVPDEPGAYPPRVLIARGDT
jgi:hypothetical protein